MPALNEVKLWHYFLLIFCTKVAVSYKPVVIIHGILDTAASMNDLKTMIVAAHPGTDVTVINLFDDVASITTPMWNQTAVVGDRLRKVMSASKDGIHLIGFSQGGLLGRAIIENSTDHNVHTFVSLSSPQMGQYGVTSYFSKYLPKVSREFLYILLYTEEFQNHITIANYWKDPMHIAEYCSDNIFLPFVNNNNHSKFANQTIYASQMKNFEKIQNLVVIGGPDDGVITPWQSALFGYYDKGLNVVPMEEQEVYLDNWFGLGTLGKRNAIHQYIFENITHIHWHGSQLVFEKAIEPWLT